MKTKTSSVLSGICSVLFAAFFVTFLYTFFHEGGHALTGILFGGNLTGFNINFFNLSAHVDLSGKFSAAQDSIKSVSGALLPLVVWTLFICFVPKKTNLMMEFVKLISSCGLAGSLLPWVVIPFLYKFGFAPAGDDVTAFLTFSQWNVWLVSVLFLVVICFVIRMFWMKADLKSLRTPDFGENGKISNEKAIAIMLSILAAVALSANVLNTTSRSLHVSLKDYRLVTTIELSKRDYGRVGVHAESVYRFSLNEDGKVKIYIVIRNINTKYIDIRLTGTGNYDYPILHGEGYWTNYDKCNAELDLRKGSYRIELTSLRSPGKVFCYVKD